MANLEKKSEKSLIFLIWKQRHIINGFARQIKSLLAEKKEFENVRIELIKMKGREEGHKEGRERLQQTIETLIDQRTELTKEVGYLKGRLAEREVSNA